METTVIKFYHVPVRTVWRFNFLKMYEKYTKSSLYKMIETSFNFKMYY